MKMPQQGHALERLPEDHEKSFEMRSFAERSASLSRELQAVRALSQENLDRALSQPPAGYSMRVLVEEEYRKKKLAKVMGKKAARARAAVAARKKAAEQAAAAKELTPANGATRNDAPKTADGATSAAAAKEVKAADGASSSDQTGT